MSGLQGLDSDGDVLVAVDGDVDLRYDRERGNCFPTSLPLEARPAWNRYRTPSPLQAIPLRVHFAQVGSRRSQSMRRREHW